MFSGKERYEHVFFVVLFFCKGQIESDFVINYNDCSKVKKKRIRQKVNEYGKLQKVCGKEILRKEFYVLSSYDCNAFIYVKKKNSTVLISKVHWYKLDFGFLSVKRTKFFFFLDFWSALNKEL